MHPEASSLYYKLPPTLFHIPSHFSPLSTPNTEHQMRTGPTGAMFLRAQALLSPVPPPAGAPPDQSHSHSPMPYLYGSLAAVFGLISLALLIYGCTHFNNSRRRDEEGGSQKPVTNRQHHRAPYVEQFVVIMAGDANPTFLATPIPIHHATNANIEKNDENDSEKTDGGTDGDRIEPH